jgi:hypothetical protein
VFLTRNPWAPALPSAGALVMEVMHGPTG